MATRKEGVEKEAVEKEEAEKAGEEKHITPEDIAKKYGIDLKKLEQEQIKLSKKLEIKDSTDFNLIESVAACDNAFFQNKIISATISCNTEFEVIEQQYFSDKLKFPYIAGFRAYRELPSMLSCFHKLEQKPDLMLIQGHGIAHPRLGLASHFSIATGVPTIGIANNLLVGKVNGEDILFNGKKIGKVFVTKPGSRPLYVSPGNLISVETAFELVKKFIRPPHKLPEPLHLARKYAKKIREELA